MLCACLFVPLQSILQNIMESKHLINISVKILLPIILGGAILFWMYRDFDFQTIGSVLLNEMDWTWMLLSFPFGITAQMFRGWRWRQTLEPLGLHPRVSTCTHAVFLSYAASLVVPRIGEFTRCGVLKRCDGISFTQALGTVVTERAVDSLVIMLIAVIAFLCQIPVFMTFFSQTGTSIESILSRFSWEGYVVTAICALAVLALVHILLRKMSIYNKVKATFSGIWQGVLSLRHINNVPLFIAYTAGIWGSYFLHYYLTFFCFDFTENLGPMCALVTFVVGSFAVLVPTPNGAGSWHFAVKTMLMLYGVVDHRALYFVLIVHSVQTVLVILLGIWAWVVLALMKRKAAAAVVPAQVLQQ